MSWGLPAGSRRCHVVGAWAYNYYLPFGSRAPRAFRTISLNRRSTDGYLLFSYLTPLYYQEMICCAGRSGNRRHRSADVELPDDILNDMQITFPEICRYWRSITAEMLFRAALSNVISRDGSLPISIVSMTTGHSKCCALAIAVISLFLHTFTFKNLFTYAPA